MEQTEFTISLTPAQAQWLSARRKRVEGVCVECGTPFVGVRQRRYCGHACAERASHRTRKAGAQLAAPADGA